MKRYKKQYMVHAKQCPQIGVVAAMQPTPPKGRGWRLVCVTAAGNCFFHFWERRSRKKLPPNDFPY
jgi:hypothetical protein